MTPDPFPPDLRPTMKCPNPFFVWFHHRSGSTHLISLLDSHPQIATWGELFYRGEAGAVEDLYTRSLAKSEAKFLQDFYSYRWDSNGANLTESDPEPPLVNAIGFKLKYQQADVYPGVMDHLCQEPRAKVIHLVRENLLAAIVSSAMIPRLLKQFRRPNLLSGEATEQVNRTVWLDPQTLVGDLAALESRIDCAREAIRGFESLEITYEDLIETPSRTCRTVLEFLNVDPTPELASRYVKIMPPSLRDAIDNWSDVADAISGTKYAPMLDQE